MQLNLEQLAALERIQSGGNFLITGKSGAGKTTLIKALAEELPNVILCAPTGSAARLIGGFTVHRMFQIPPYPIVDVKMLPPLGRFKRKLLKQVETVIIDEISMLRGDVLRAVDHRLRQCAKSFDGAQQPFGGKNMVFVGDFFQLPPVVNGLSEGTDLDTFHEKNGVYAFQTDSWQCANVKPIYLKQIMRQTDSEFIKILNVLRTNEEEEIPTVLEKLNSRVADDIPEQAVYLCSTKHIAAARNAGKFSELQGEAKTFTATVTGEFNPKEYPTERELKLKIGQRVIATTNTKEVCNGDLGTIIDFTTSGAIVEFDSGVRTELLPVETPQYSCKIDKDENGEEKIIVFKCGSFIQLPLVPGYAITIHRSQGMTIPSVVLDIGAGCFASGQLYVAISRCKSLESLQLLQEISEDDIFIDGDIVEEEIFWKVDAGLIHETLWKELKKLDGAQLDMLSLDQAYATQFLQFFISSYLDAFDSDADALSGELPQDDYLQYLEEKLYQLACNLHLNRPLDRVDAMTTLGTIANKLYPVKNKGDKQ